MIPRILHLAAITGLLVSSHASAAPLYYDTNGATSGTATSSTQNFTDSVWTTDSTGASLTTGYTAGSDIVFSATDGVNVGTGTQSVTVTDTESANSFTFDNGTVTLFGSGSPNLSLGAGGITVASTINGATTFDSSLGTLTLTAGQEWDNNSSQALNLNSNVTASGSTLTLGGTGTGNINLNGQLTGSLNLTATGVADTVYLVNTGNNFSGTVTADGGAIVAEHESTLAGNSITLENGGTIEMNDTQGFGGWNNTINLGTGGGQIVAGTVAGGGIDLVYSGFISGGTGLTLQGGDLLLAAAGGSDIGTLNVNNGRLLAIGSGDFDNNTVVNVASVLDMGVGGTFGNTINLENGGALENRSGGVSLTDVVMPTGDATVTLGADDSGGGSITLNGPAINLANATTLTLDINENHVSSLSGPDTTVYLDEAITGSGALNLTLIPGYYNEGTVVLGGNNTYSGPTTINGLTVYPGSNGFGTSIVTSNSATFELTGGNLANHFIANSGNTSFNMAGNTDQTISGPIELSATGAAAYFRNSGTGNLTIDNISYDSLSGNYAAFDAANGSSITLNGTYTTPAGSNETMSFGAGDYMGSEANANYYLGPNADFTNFQTDNYGGGSTISLNAGNLHIDTSLFGPAQYIAVVNNAGDNHTIDIDGSQNISAIIYTQEKYGPNPIGQWTMNQETADASVWSGVINQNATSLIASAVDGGRLTFTNDITGTAPAGVIKTGAGVVVFADPNGSDYGIYNGDPTTPSYGVTAPFAVDIQQGTLLIFNQQGYALGNNGGAIVVEKGATFGGSGTINPNQTVVAKDATSVIAPGDAGQANLNIKASIGTLTLAGVTPGATAGQYALEADNGLTLDFKLSGDGVTTDQFGVSTTTPGVSNDFLTIGGGGMTLSGPITINLIALGDTPIVSGAMYTLIQDYGNWDGDPTSITFTAPAGYELDPNFGPDDGLGDGKDLGYVWDPTPGAGGLYVELLAIPEPSTYGLLGLGLLTLVAIGRYRRLGQS